MEINQQTIMNIQSQVDTIERDVQKVAEGNARLDKKVSQIIDLLSGQELNPMDKGMIGKIEKMSKYIEELETRIETQEKWREAIKNRIIGWTAAGVVGGFSVTGIIVKLFEALTK